MKRKRVSKSVFFRLFLAIFLVVIPINIILMIYAVLVFNSVNDQAVQERTSVMHLYMSTLDSSVDQITAAFYRENTSQEILTLMQSDVELSQSEFEWYGARTELMNLYQQWITDYPVFEGFFSYFDYMGKGENSYAVRSYYGRTVEDINKEIIRIVEKNIEAAEERGTIYHGSGWEYIRIRDEDYLLRIWKSRNCYYGGWINLNSVLDAWNQQSATSFTFVFSDSRGRICSDVPEKTDLIYGKPYPHTEKMPVVSSRTTGIHLIAAPEKTFLLDSMPTVVIVLMIMTLLALAAIPLLIIITRKYILKPVNQLLDAMEEVRGGNLDYQIPSSDITGEFAILDKSFNCMIRQLRDTKIAAYESEVERQRIQMRYLSQQIKPHFVLNTLNILYSYEPEEYPLIQKMILCLSKYFRYIVKVHSDFVDLSQELEHIKNYFEIQMARYPEQFDYYVESEEGMDTLLIPPLLIQNFTENSIKYAISMEKKVSIYVLVQFYENDKMRIRIADTGKGLPDAILESIERFRKTHKYQENLGIGIQNAIERLEIMYNGVSKIMFYNSVSGGATVDIIMPCMRKNEEEENEDGYDCR